MDDRIGHVLDMGPPRLEAGDLGPVDVVADDVESDVGGPHRQRQADVALTEHDDIHGRDITHVFLIGPAPADMSRMA